MNSPHILLIDDDIELCQMLATYLNAEGLNVESVNDGESALRLVAKQSFDALVLDIMMPGKDGLEVLQALRVDNPVPVIMLTGRGDDIDRIIGLEMGADDYMGKPCNPRELLARIKAVLRRGGTKEPVASELNMQGIKLSVAKLEVSFKSEPLVLTSAEFNVLKHLMLNAGHTISKGELTQKALNRELTAHDRSIDVHVSRVRNKLNKLGAHEDLIRAVRGVGYQFLAEE